MGVAGLLPDVFWSLTWPDYDRLLFHHRYQQQLLLLGHREVAARLYNSVGAFAQNFKALTAAQYWPLPLVDPPPPPPEPVDLDWWAKMAALAAKSGKTFASIHD